MVDLGALSGSVAIQGVDDAIRGLSGVGEASNSANNGIERFAVTGAQARVALIGLGTAIAAISVVSVKLSDELKKATNTLQVQTNSAAEEMDGLQESLKNIYAENYGESFEDIAQSMANVKQQTKLTGQALEETTINALAMRDSFDMEVGESIRAVDMMMRQFGVTSEEAYNLIAQGAQKGLDKNQNLLDSVNEYSVHFKQLGFNANQMFNMFSNGAEQGVFDIDKLGDAVKEFGIRAQDGSTTTVEAFEALNLNADELQSKFAAGGESANQAFQEVTQALVNCNDTVIQTTSGVNLFGTMYEDLGITAIAALTDINGELSAQKDVLTSIKEIKYDDLGSAWSGIGRQLQMDVLIPFGEKLLPYLNDLATWIEENKDEIANGLGVALDTVANGISWVADNLDTLIPIAGSALGALLALKTVATVQSIITSTTTSINGLRTALTFLEAHPVVLGLTAIGAAVGLVTTEAVKATEQQKKLNEELQKTIDLKADMSGGSTAELEKEKNVLEAQLVEYGAITDKHEELIARRDELNQKMNNTSLTGEETAEYYKLEEELASLSLTYTKVNDKIAEQFGTLEDGKSRLDAYNNRIENASKANSMLAEATTSQEKALINEALSLQSVATKAELLYKEYEELASKSNLTKEETENMTDRYEQLVSIMGSGIAVYNQEKDAMVINQKILMDSINATDKQSKAKLDEAENVKNTTKAYVEAVDVVDETTEAYKRSSETKVDMTKQEAKAALEAAEAYLVALEAQGSYWQTGEAQSKINELRAYIQGIEEEEKEAYRSNQTDALKSAQDKYTQEKKLGDLTLREQLNRLKTMKSEYASTSENIIAINEFSQSEIMEIIENIAEAENLSTQDKIALYEDAKNNYCNTYSDKKTFTEQINSAIKEDVENLVEDITSLTDDELEATKSMLKDKMYEYKDYAWAIEDIEKDLASIKEEEASREIEQAKETVDALIAERKRLYDEQIDEIDEASKSAIKIYEDELAAMEQSEKNKELLKKDYELRQRIAEAETIEDRKAREEEYQEWLDKVDADRYKQSLRDSITTIKDQVSNAKEDAKTNYDNDVQSYSDFLALEEEKIRLRKENETSTEEEITKLIADQHKQQEEDLQAHIEEMKALYSSQLEWINAINGTDYKLRDYKAELGYAESAASSFIQSTVTNNNTLTPYTAEFANLLSEANSRSTVNALREAFGDVQTEVPLNVDGDTLGYVMLPLILRAAKSMGVRLSDY